MAIPIDPDLEGGGTGDGTGGGTTAPGQPGYVPPSSAGSVLAVVTANSAYTFTEQEIVAAGGPWAEFIVKITPINDNGAGPHQSIRYPSSLNNVRVTSSADKRITQNGDIRIGEQNG